MFFYKASLLTRIPKFMSFQQGRRMTVIQMPLASFSPKPIFDAWDWGVYARVLSKYTDLPLEELTARGGVWTWLDNGDGTVPDIDFDTIPCE
jgi:hypothetical protein